MNSIKMFLKNFIMALTIILVPMLTVNANDIGWCSNYDPAKLNADEVFSGNSCGLSGTQTLDSCLVGHWEMDADSYRNEVEAIWGDKPGEIVAAVMAFEMVIRSDGFVQYCVDGETGFLMPEGAMRAKSPKAETDVWIKGGGLSFMSMRGPGSFCANDIESNVTFKSEVRTMGMTMPQNIQSKSVLPTEAEYTCEGNQLTVTSYPEGSDVLIEHTYQRRH